MNIGTTIALAKRLRFSRNRNKKGNMIALTAAVTLGIVLVLLFFALKYTRMLGSNQEQTTAIQAAALAVATDLSKVVIDDPNFGLVSLSDYAPIGSDTLAGDGYSMPVQSINTIIGTIRLDMVIADQVNDQTMLQLAKRDLGLALTAQNNLYAALQNVLSSPSSVAYDINGQPITPYHDALTAYNQNINRMTGNQTSIAPNTLKLTLGMVANIPTCTAIPQPPQYADVSTQQVATNNGVPCYRAYVNCPHDNQNFVFAAVGSSVTLVDPTQFTLSANLPYSLPTIVKAEADQVYNDTQYGQAGQRIIHAAACAEPASVTDPRPHPGTLVVSFPDGRLPELNTIADLWHDPELMGLGLTMDTPNGGDYGAYSPGVLRPTTLPGGVGATSGTGTTFSAGWSKTFYDWLRRAGTRVSVDTVNQMLTAPFGNGQSMNEYNFVQSGPGPVSIQQTVVTSGNRFPLVSDHQFIASGKNPYVSNNKNSYDAVIIDETFNSGRLNGGIHGGEPFANQINPTPVSSAPTQPIPMSAPCVSWTGPSGGWGHLEYAVRGHGPMNSSCGDQTVPAAQPYPSPPTGGQGTTRPTYQTTPGMTADVTFHLLIVPPSNGP